MKDGIIKRGSSFHAVVRETGSNGKTKPVWSKAFSTREEAEAYRDRRRVEVREGTAVAKNSMTLREYMDSWLPKHIALAGLAPTTQVAYRSKINLYIKPRLGDIRLQALRAHDIEAFYTSLLTTPSSRRESGLAPRTVIYVARILRKALQHAVDVHQLLAKNPAQSVPLPSAEPIHRELWNAQQMQAFLTAADEGHHGALLWLLGATGARRGELLALRWQTSISHPAHSASSRVPLSLTDSGISAYPRTRKVATCHLIDAPLWFFGRITHGRQDSA